MSSVPFDLLPRLPFLWEHVPAEDTATTYTIERKFPDKPNMKDIVVRVVLPTTVSPSLYSPSKGRVMALFKSQSTRYEKDGTGWKRVTFGPLRQRRSSRSHRLDRLLYILYSGMDLI